MNTIPKPTQTLPSRFNTPQILNGGLYAVWGISLFLLLVSIFGINAQRQAIKSVGKDAAPSILTAQQLRDSFADIDASLANELLLKPGANQQALADFEKNQKKIADRLVAGAKNITYPAEENILQTLQLKSTDYFLLLQAARDAHQRGDKVGVLNTYRLAANLMDKEILTKAEELDRVNSVELESTYNRQRFENGGIMLLIAIAGLIQLGILGALQFFIYRRMRRVFNVYLLAASAISLITVLWTLNSLLSAASNLKVAKEDTFNSIYVLRQARALSYMANADESRYLLDAANADNHEQAFQQKIDKLVAFPKDKSLKEIISQIPASPIEEIKIDGFGGFYANQLSNITFAGELEKTVETLKKLDEYLQIDKQIRQLYRSGKITEAIALCTGNKTGQSNWAFDRYKVANENLRKINEQAFEQKITAGFDDLSNFEVIAAISIGSIGILTLLGLRPRLKEYL